MNEKIITNIIRNLSAVCAVFLVLPDLEAASPIPDISPVVWFDAKDAGTITGTNPVTQWSDKSGNDRHATKTANNSKPKKTTNGPNGQPIVQIRRSGGDDFLAIGGSAFIAKEHYYVFRSKNNNDRFNYYGGVLGHTSGRGSNYLWQHNQPYFHSNRYPESVKKNGGALISSGNRNISPVNTWMVLRLTVDNTNLSPKSNYRIGECDNYNADVDICEIVAFDSVISDQKRA
ncbi:uncharacterized protein METZ01_LOCUS322332, partial [marine metagenome]